jgi:hypothetical protein
MQPNLWRNLDRALPLGFLALLCTACSDSDETTTVNEPVRLGEPMIIGGSHEGNTLFDKIAMNEAGSAAVVWTEQLETASRVWATSYEPDIGWESALQIDAGQPAPVGDTQIAIDSQGYVLAVWYTYNSDSQVIWSNRRAAGSGWAGAEIVAEEQTADAGPPRLAMNTDGRAWLVWYSGDANRSIKALPYDPENGWGSPLPIGVGSRGTPHTELAMSDDGTAIAMWVVELGTYPFTGSTFAGYFSRYSPETGWSTAAEVTRHIHSDPRLAMAAGGYAAATWSAPAHPYVQAVVGRFTPPATIWSETALELRSASSEISLDDAGDALVGWVSQPGDGPVTVQRVPNGAGPEAPQSIDAPDHVGTAGHLRFAGNGSGNVVATWVRSNDTLDDVWLNRHQSGAGWQAAARLATGSATCASVCYSGSNPEVAMSHDGTAIVVWNQRHEDHSDVWASIVPASPSGKPQ